MSGFAIGPGRKPIQLIGVNTPFEPKIQFGYHHGPDADQRQQTFGESPLPGRNHSRSENGVNQPAPQREQTILRSRLSPELQRQLQTGFTAGSQQGRRHQPVPQLETIHAPAHSWQNQRQHTIGSVPHASGRWVLHKIAQ